MISARAIDREILDHDETYRLFCSVAAKGEAQGGWENRRIAALTRDDALRARILRHGEDEDKHGSRAKRAVLWFGIHAIYTIERLWGWRRMASIEPPARPGAMSPRVPQAENAAA